VETFARNATLLGQEYVAHHLSIASDRMCRPLLAGHPRTVRLPFELSFSELVVQVTPPSQPFVPDVLPPPNENHAPCLTCDLLELGANV